ncbi:similar to Saccharomyces cerevisiae YER019W ISC1 Mitochondrial membrane localized inositol phosphosphingolipid phospholipase C, hydrolyzes complex sphingolipids to produce ceramide [Maudiozyma barnettii]|uniref:Similar to Saccharomyces cerevisiae YER019W ISC1 Mitochondrial membrane localized inositol phosphosphingolipid phospholipase C, hydrolyzes complex sphingolipids to produce ceramide n=1 Tax=Maudiozyma barnettii TaxID=61262 RepID=A0A8H2VDJ3_9SACH|nr:inositol phosphosphingolipid phospholipase [Kazachstania barnettii]CAB4253308.1 similar to Saccharomyces cerevisiae YER019W ISC1 Mitochondrial membrane localized inositol phosphosphingolipid phospholipase C, hydrolyzes complex sphingolipids to produce ceramide [Kazachstania barnettii]CAD1780808.1 similar to Saccharomyces cerevisiae YER019W ISC1 Mitochondrial membrane localized inositol phosphosphingolipid phospholipase C, hydrolyzes complex sphingolipids to produce ceramide [Kazachstania barne
MTQAAPLHQNNGIHETQLTSENTLLQKIQPRVKFLTFNTWGLKFVSKHRKERLRAIADKLSGSKVGTPIEELNVLNTNENGEQDDEESIDDYDIVALQEIWCKEDWDYINLRCKERFPYTRIFYSGIITGPGLAILSKIPIESTFLYRFPINGRPSAFFRGDWYVGKSIAVTLLKPLTKDTYPIAIMNSHMHAPYAMTGDAAYECHRSCQAWDFSKLANLYRKANYAVVIVGDLNSRPGSLPHKFLTAETGLVDSWLQLHGKQDIVQISKMNAVDQLKIGCTTCDSQLNTWRAQRQPDEAKRLDYALIDPTKLNTINAGARFTERLDNIGSFSDHFAYTCTLELLPRKTGESENLDEDDTQPRKLLLERFASYEEMLRCINKYMITAKKQKLFRGIHFILSVLCIIACLVVTTFTSNKAAWSSIFWVLFATVVSVTGLIDGMISFFFGRSEIRALWEVEQEVQDAERYMQMVLDKQK